MIVSPEVRPLLIAVAAVLGIDLVLLLVAAWRRYRLGLPTFAWRWSLVDLWLGLQGGFFLLLLTFVPVLFLFVAFRLNVSLDPKEPGAIWLLLASLPVQNGVFFVVPVCFVNLKYGLSLRDIGLPPLPQGRHIVAGLLLGMVAMMISDAVGRGMGALAEQYRHVEWVAKALEYEKTNPVAQMMEMLPRAGLGALALAVLGIGIAAPLGEEMLLRGFVFNIFKRRFGVAAGMVLSALLFTLPHSYSLGLVPVFLMGIGLAWVYHVSGSLWPGIFLHATNNTVAVLLAYFFPTVNG